MKLPTAREALVLVAAAFVFALQCQHSRDDATDIEALQAVLANRDKALKDASVSLATKDGEITALKRLQEVATTLGGNQATVVAGFGIRVPRRDTVIKHDTIRTVIYADSTRVASFSDSTFAGILTATITAPPFPAPLRLDSLRVERPAFRPEVGFIKIGSQYLAAVSWRGEKVTVDAAFFQPPQEKRKRIGGFLEGTYSVLGGAHEARAGMTLRLGIPGAGPLAGQYFVGPTVAQRLSVTEKPLVGVTLRKEW